MKINGMRFNPCYDSAVTFSATSSSAASSNALGVRLRNVSRMFDGGVRAIDNLNLDISAGEFAALLGPSGCGKSTLLRLIARLDQPNHGVVEVNPGTVAYVFQDAHLMPWRSVLRNVALPLELRGVGQTECCDAAAAALEQVGLADAIHLYPAQLSGGMRMRASLARALVTNPGLLLLDEPFAALDELTRQRLDEQLHALWRERRMTVLFVTHSIAEAAFLARRAVVFTSRPARIMLDHAIDLPEDRLAGLRATPEFARQTGILYDALERGERP